MNPALTSLQCMRYAIPEIALGLGALLVLKWDLFVKGRARFAGIFGIALSALAVSGIASALELRESPRWPLPAVLFDGHLSCDAYACVFRVLFAAVTALVVVAAIPTCEAKVGARGGAHSGAEMVALILVVCLGMNLMAMARTLLLVYLAVETVGIASFVLTALRGGDGATRSHEASLKYLVYGGVASGVMLYGMSWLYGLARSLALPDIAERTLAMTRDVGHIPNALGIATACVVVGLAYKVAAAPFHMWAPDVFESAPTVVAAFLSVGPPVAAFALLVRVAREGFGVQSLSAEPLAAWSILAGSLAVATMTAGNLAALVETKMKRLLAYAAIAQAGTMLLAFAVFDAEGVTAVAFCAVAFCATNLGAFLVVFAVSEAAGGDDSIAALRGLGTRAPALAVSLGVFLVSLAGLPPFAGFVAKLYVVAALLRAPGEYHAWYWFLACAGVANTGLSLACGARVLRAMYLEPAAEKVSWRVAGHAVHTVMALALTIPIVLLGVWWGPLYDFLSSRVATLP